MVEGWLLKAESNDPLDRCIEVGQHASCGNSQNGKALRLQECIAAHIPQWPVAHIVGPAVDFDRDPPLQTGKIQNQLTERMVPPKLETGRTFA